MKNKKGFTLVELIVTIVILTIILLLGIVTFNKIQKSVRNRQFENIKSRIKVAGEKYINDTSVNIVFVDTLIKEGYLQANNSGIILDPRDKKQNLNCYKYENGILSEGTQENGVCKINGEEPLIYQLVYCDATDGNCEPNSNYNSNIWYNIKKIKLGIKIEKFDEIRWFDRKDPSKPIIINENFEYTTDLWINQDMNVEVTKGLNKQTKEFILKIDNVKPTATIINPEDITKQKVKRKTINFDIKDEESGVAGCLFSSNNNLPSDAAWGECVKSKTYTLEDNSKTEYLYVKDNAGNISDGIEIKVQNIIPGCTPGTYDPPKEVGACNKNYVGKYCNSNEEWENIIEPYPACKICNPGDVPSAYNPNNLACGNTACKPVCNEDGTEYVTSADCFTKTCEEPQCTPPSYWDNSSKTCVEDLKVDDPIEAGDDEPLCDDDGCWLKVEDPTEADMGSDTIDD